MRNFVQVILISFTLMAVGIGGYFGYQKLQKYQEMQFTKANDAPPIYITMPPVYQAIYRNGHVFETREYIINLESRPGDPYKIAKSNLPRIRDLVISKLNALATRRGPENIDNLDYVRSEIMQAITRQIRPGLVFNVVFVGINNHSSTQ